MAPKEMMVRIYCHRNLWRRLAWPLVKAWLYAMVGMGKLTGEQAYDIGTGFLVKGVSYGVGKRGERRKVEIDGR